MSNVLQFIGTFASIFSIPLAVILFFKTSDARQNKICLDIIRSLSYRIGEGKALDTIEVSAVLNSKVQEHNIRRPFFTEVTILEDIIADAVSNPFLTSDQKTSIIKDISSVLEAFGAIKKQTTQKEGTNLKIEHTLHGSIVSETKNKRSATTNAFSFIATVMSTILAIATLFIGNNFSDVFSEVHFPVEVLISIIVTIFAAILTFLIQFVIKKKNK